MSACKTREKDRERHRVLLEGALVGQRKPCPAEISTIMMDPNRRGMDRYAGGVGGSASAGCLLFAFSAMRLN